jgi:methyl acetate hydrolase
MGLLNFHRLGGTPHSTNPSLRLDAFITKNIFEPLNITDMTFYPDQAILSRKMLMCERKDGKVVVTANGYGMNRSTPQEGISGELPSGGAGLYGTQKSYLAILRAILQCAPEKRADPTFSSTAPLISVKSYEELFKGCVNTQAGRQAMIGQVSRAAYFPGLTTRKVDHSVGFLINHVEFEGRRGKLSGCWSGAAKTQFWIDPSNGIAVSLGSTSCGGSCIRATLSSSC